MDRFFYPILAIFGIVAGFFGPRSTGEDLRSVTQFSKAEIEAD